MANVEKVSIALSNELLRAVRDAVGSGEYASASEVVREALREWRGRRPRLNVAAERPAALPLLSASPGALRELMTRFGVQHLAAFGSALRADFNDQSDIDLAVEFVRDEALDPADQYFGLKAALEQLFARRVDLVEMSALRDSRLKREILRTQVPLHDEAA